MHTFIPLTVLLIWNGFGINLLHMSDMDYIIDKARQLCPYNSICGEPPLATTAITPGIVPCCTDCSCEPDCYQRNDCCFPTPGTRLMRSECLSPVSKQVHGYSLFGFLKFHMVVDVKTCQTSFNLQHTLTSPSKNHSDNVTDGAGEKCGQCSCDINIKTNSYTSCECDSQILNQTEDCPCGDVKVASWGSMFPVYSRSSGLIYKNPVCAICHGIKDGIILNPFVTCQSFSLHFVGDMLGKAYSDKRCAVGFTSPSSIEQTQLPRCLDYRTNSCFGRELPQSLVLNMTTDEVRDACNSNFTSPFPARYKNVFCFLCDNEPVTECVDNVGTKLWDGSFFTIIIGDVFLEDKNANRKKMKKACSKSSPSECREILCPSGQVRDGNGDCVYPMIATYVRSYSVILRLYSNTYNLQKIINSQPGHKINEGQLKSPWSEKWVQKVTLLETSRLNQFGELDNTSSFIVQIALINPYSKDVKILLKEIVHSQKKKWSFLISSNKTTVLESEFCEHNNIIFPRSTNIIVPGGFNAATNLTAPIWKLQWMNDSTWLNSMFKNHQSITRLMFCEQLMLHPHEYSLSSGGEILYMKSDHRYFFGGQFVYDADGDRSVRVCLDDTEFIREVSSSHAQYAKDVAICAIIIATLCTINIKYF